MTHQQIDKENDASLHNKIAISNHTNQKRKQTCEKPNGYASCQQSKKQRPNTRSIVPSPQNDTEGIKINHLYKNMELTLP